MKGEKRNEQFSETRIENRDHYKKHDKRTRTGFRDRQRGEESIIVIIDRDQRQGSSSFIKDHEY